MKKLHAISMLPVMLILLSLTLMNSSCKKETPTKLCEEKNTFILTVKNTALSGNLNFNVNRDFNSSTEPGDHSVKPGESKSIELNAGSHTVYAKNMRTVCANGRCTTTVTGQADKTVNQQSCTEANLVY
jgi:hypothetical protein